MLKRLFRQTPRALPRDIESEIASICRASQIERLSLSPHLRRDVGLDCGCQGENPAR
ncbi:hypothetical protein [Aliiruegeria lutimaris]|uniref:Uncharacterized protein n=1 Tax=Aliiruegeria lutimaris TaxID=571298 RepID=A0A1G8ZS01_9RHOB|nr:hypothetical protein [Aliiruegeria lutimaris]SDK17817.1 hypothetical protein SAMN04488026_103327 [Aliiruegeria lutimaris]